MINSSWNAVRHPLVENLGTLPKHEQPTVVVLEKIRFNHADIEPSPVDQQLYIGRVRIIEGRGHSAGLVKVKVEIYSGWWAELMGYRLTHWMPLPDKPDPMPLGEGSNIT